MGALVPLKISSALLLLDPSMYSEKNSSVGAARALPSEKTSGTRAARTRAGRNSRRRPVCARREKSAPGVDLKERPMVALSRAASGEARAGARVVFREALPRHDVRVPDERARLRAHQGPARVARPWRGRLSGGGGRDRLQHVHRAREAGYPLCGPSRAGGRAQERRSREG